MAKESNNQFLLGLFGGIALVSIVGLIILGVAFVNKDNNNSEVAGQNEINAPVDQQVQPPAEPTGPQLVAPTVSGIKTFSEKKDAEICTEDGLPVVYLFSTTWCPHCTWIKDTFNSTIKEYVDAGKIKAHHWEIDINDDVLTTEVETQVPADHLAVYREFNPRGSIPTFVFGCKYTRIGNGYEGQDDLVSEEAEFKAVIEDLIK